MIYLSILLMIIAVSPGSALAEGDEEKRMMGGLVIGIESAPYQVAVVRKQEVGASISTTIFVCGGTLVSKRTVVTASSCFFEHPNLLTYLVRAGAAEWKKSDYERSLSAVLFHDGPTKRGWTPIKFGDYIDLALLITQEAFPIIPNTIQPANLPVEGEQIQEGWEMKIAGWGKKEKLRIGDDDKKEFFIPDDLSQGRFAVMNMSACRAIINSARYDDLFISRVRQLCAVDANVYKEYKQCRKFVDVLFCAELTGKNTWLTLCENDEGGGLMMNNTLYAVYSTKAVPCDPEHPQIFTNVPHVMRWIWSYIAVEDQIASGYYL